MTATISHDSEAPAHGQQVITACALIHHDFNGTPKVFLAKRASTKKFLPGVFELPGGHINWGEDIVEGLQREVVEELGVHINVGDPFAVFTYTNDVKGSHSVEVVYFATCVEPIEQIMLYPEDHSEYMWIAQGEVTTISQISDQELINVKKGLAILQSQPLSRNLK